MLMFGHSEKGVIDFRPTAKNNDKILLKKMEPAVGFRCSVYYNYHYST